MVEQQSYFDDVINVKRVENGNFLYFKKYLV